MSKRKANQKQNSSHKVETLPQAEEAIRQVEGTLSTLKKSLKVYSKITKEYTLVHENLSSSLVRSGNSISDSPGNNFEVLCASLGFVGNVTNTVKDLYDNFLDEVKKQLLFPLQAFQSNEIHTAKNHIEKYKLLEEMENLNSTIPQAENKRWLNDEISRKNLNKLEKRTLGVTNATIKVAELSMIESMCVLFDLFLEFFQEGTQHLVQLLPEMFQLVNYVEEKKIKMQKELKRKETVLLEKVSARQPVNKNRIFGLSLSTLVRKEKCLVPSIVVQTIHYLEENKAIKTEGIFRVSGEKENIDLMQQTIDNSGIVQIKEGTDIHDVASLFKLWMRSLPEPLIPFDMFDSFINLRKGPHDEQSLIKAKALLTELPKENFATISVLINFLSSINKNSSQNMMDSINLATVVGPSLLIPKQIVLDRELMMQHAGLQRLAVSFMIDNAEKLFPPTEEVLLQDFGFSESSANDSDLPIRPSLTSPRFGELVKRLKNADRTEQFPTATPSPKFVNFAHNSREPLQSPFDTDSQKKKKKVAQKSAFRKSLRLDRFTNPSGKKKKPITNSPTQEVAHEVQVDDKVQKSPSQPDKRKLKRIGTLKSKRYNTSKMRTRSKSIGLQIEKNKVKTEPIEEPFISSPPYWPDGNVPAAQLVYLNPPTHATKDIKSINLNDPDDPKANDTNKESIKYVTGSRSRLTKIPPPRPPSNSRLSLFFNKSDESNLKTQSETPTRTTRPRGGSVDMSQSSKLSVVKVPNSVELVSPRKSMSQRENLGHSEIVSSKEFDRDFLRLSHSSQTLLKSKESHVSRITQSRANRKSISEGQTQSKGEEHTQNIIPVHRSPKEDSVKVAPSRPRRGSDASQVKPKFITTNRRISLPPTSDLKVETQKFDL